MDAGPRTRGRVLFLALAGVVAVGASCATAGGEVTGGGLTEPGAIAIAPLEGGMASESPQIEMACSTPEWSALYRDIFGPVGQPGSCTFNTTCHGTPESAGVKGGGIECYDERGCCASMFTKGMVRPGDALLPEKSPLIRILRRETADGRAGFMPKEPAEYVYPDTSLERIQAWIRGLGDGGVSADASTD